VILPLQKQEYKNFETSYQAFLNEWVKIENEISNPFYNLYILKGIIDAAREVRHLYTIKETRDESIKTFRLSVYNIIEKVSTYCLPKNIHYEKLLCSLYVFSRSLEGFFYETMNKITKVKDEEYTQLPLKSVDQIYGVITTNIPDEYVYNDKTKIMVIDNVGKNMNEYRIPKDELENVNDITHLAKGTYINDLIINT
jgi:hypothetical protein